MIITRIKRVSITMDCCISSAFNALSLIVAQTVATGAPNVLAIDRQ
jgi:hypothetical protein